MNLTAVFYALIAAVLFGISTPVAKVLVGSTHPVVLAGLLYCGAGVGVAVLRKLPWDIFGSRRAREAALNRADLPWLAGAVVAGGVVGPILLLVGLTRTDASTASLLLTLEGVATALIACSIFHDSFDRSFAAGMLSLAYPLQIVTLKGTIAGPVNLLLGVAAGGALPDLSTGLMATFVGFLCYGVSLALFVLALRHLGSARTAAYFSTAPFFGAIAAVIALHESVTYQPAAAGALMAVGVWLHVTEQHDHEHAHETQEHTHAHIHDETHQHSHGPNDPAGEPHTHRHAHKPLTHSHPHMPDMHHQHRH